MPRLLDNKTKIVSRAPMRISFGGGGTELSPYVETYGGCVLSAALGVYAHVQLSIDPNLSGFRVISQETEDQIQIQSIESFNLAECPASLKLASACLQYFSRELKQTCPNGLVLNTGSEAPIGSGLGASSVLTVAIVNALQSMFELHMQKNLIAETAHKIERHVLGLSGGLQDHYPAIYGGVNFIDFSKEKKATIQPLELSNAQLSLLESSLLLIYSGQSRESASIIEVQTNAVRVENSSTIEYFHNIKALADRMRIAMLNSDISKLGSLLDESWSQKKLTNSGVTNARIDSLYEKVMQNGAYGGKVSGAGGGGFLMFVVPPEKKVKISKMLGGEESVVFPSNLVAYGSQTSRIPAVG